MMRTLMGHSRRVERLRSTLEHLHETRRDDHPRSLPAIGRVVAAAVPPAGSSVTGTQGAVARFIKELRDVGGLKGTDIANITEVSKATVSRWSQGAASPHPRTQLVLSDLHYIVGRLEEYYSAEEIRTWLYARHPQLDGARAIDLINQGRSEEVLRILDRLDAGVYL